LTVPEREGPEDKQIGLECECRQRQLAGHSKKEIHDLAQVDSHGVLTRGVKGISFLSFLFVLVGGGGSAFVYRQLQIIALRNLRVSYPRGAEDVR
jgi:hypothetical protein